MASGKKFTHLGNDNETRMVAIDHKTATRRTAVAECQVNLPDELQAALRENELYTPKGAVFETARVAGIMAVKKTAELIPLCHTILIEKCDLDLQPGEAGIVRIRCTVGTTGKTGVEMEALTGASVAALTVYDMCKAISHDIVIGPLRLIEKTGGKSDLKKGRETSLPKASVSKTNVKGLVLCGGQSRRMQTDKSLLDYHGLPHWQYLCRLLDPFVDEVWISCRKDQAEQFGNEANLIFDREDLDIHGPAGGILAAAARFPGESWVVVACDLPLVTAESMKTLVEGRDPKAAATAFLNPEKNWPEPLLAIWEPAGIQALAGNADAGRHCPRKTLEQCNPALLTYGDPSELFNANTPDDRRQAEDELKTPPVA